jgi:hypothetical protein
MEKSKNVQQPQHHTDDHDSIQDGLNRSFHWYEAVDQPKENTHHDQNQQYLKYRHELLTSFSSQADTPTFRKVRHQISVLNQELLVPDEVGWNLRSPVFFRRKPLDLFLHLVLLLHPQASIIREATIDVCSLVHTLYSRISLVHLWLRGIIRLGEGWHPWQVRL